ncbi:Ig-like domain-containing protein [Fluviicola taffensis]|uniref:Ig-like domain-containing protein n=1 Tax=Fluviicola taffensis (strain DSM 16823 / NCIMB 13979 / RW262) TaxID=755732 RepID=F2IAP9_FLUTR|nr:Ig-like domain-containing protein [Fluviicola taffensis]AEA44204.1 hypothetical protein Fluta_2218 [Fluviicola taffensis DSM 16823]
MKRNNLLLLFFITVVYFSSVSQQDITLHHQQIVQLGSGRFFDQGGENGEMPNEYLRATIKAPTGYIHAFFTAIDIPSGSELRIYKGQDTIQLIGLYNGTYKPMDFFGKSFTIVYDPKSSVGTAPGFSGLVQPIPVQDVMEKATLPESDCIGAIPLCSNLTVNTSANQYENTGNVNDDNGSCYSGTGNGGSVWYSFSPQTNGNLDFMINPTGSTDYDFVLWDITAGCANKTQLSCNYSATQGATGLNSSGSSNSQDASGTTNNSLVAVQTTKVYALCINYYGGTNAGFTLGFHNIASTVNIVDNTPPTISSAYSSNCAASTSFTVNFSEYIDCNTLQASDFAIPGYTVTIITTNCVNGKTNSVVLGVSPSMPPGNYSMTVNDMNDLCGNPLNQVYPINTLVTPTANAGPDRVACSTIGFFGIPSYGSVTLTGSGGTSYIWSTGQTGASVSVSPSSSTTYTLTAISGNCSSTDQVNVTVSASPVVNLGPDQTICSGFPVTLNASGGGTYQWQSTTNGGFFGTPTGWANIGGATGSSYTASPTGTIYYQVNVTNAQGCTGKDFIKITIGSGTFGITAPPFVCQGSSVTLTLPGSMTAYTWNQAGTPVGTANTPLTVSPSATTTYTAVSTTVGCTGSASVTVPVHPLGTLTTNVSPASACPGVPVNLTSTAPAETYITQTENFESANSFTFVNGTVNRWYYGTGAAANGTKSIYVGTATGNNNYVTTNFLGLAQSSINFAYKNYTITSYCSPTLSFNWRCNGLGGTSELTIWAVPTTITPTAGTAITATGGNVLLGGPYSGSNAFSNVVLSLANYAGQSVRIVFQWRSEPSLFSPGSPNNSAACIDDVVFTDNTTYSYAWVSSPAGFTASTVNATANPTAATNYTMTATRCDGCPMASSIAVIDCNPLPVGLLEFKGEKKERENKLIWITENEVDLDYFILERSPDGINWEFVTNVDPSGNSNELTHDYSVSDYSFTRDKINYYRLIQKENDGKRVVADKMVSIDNRIQSKVIIGRTNLLGQTISDNQKGLVILIYEDGTSEKVFLQD